MKVQSLKNSNLIDMKDMGKLNFKQLKILSYKHKELKNFLLITKGKSLFHCNYEV